MGIPLFAAECDPHFATSFDLQFFLSVFYIAAFLSPLIRLVTNRPFPVTKHQKISRLITR